MNDEFNAPDGDIILRVQGSPNRDFRVHKIVLSLASPVFKDMFSLPQPRSEALEAKGGADTEVVDVTDPPQALALVLKLIYPFLPPNIANLDLLVEALVVTDKYNIEGARARLRVKLPKFVNKDPLRVYAIACRFGFDEEAEAVSSLTTGTYLPALPQLPDDFKYLSPPAYHRLMVVHAKRHDSIEDAVDTVPFQPTCPDCKLTKSSGGEPKMRTKLARIISRGQPVTVGQCIEGLGITCTGVCLIKFIAEGVVKKLGGNAAIQS